MTIIRFKRAAKYRFFILNPALAGTPSATQHWSPAERQVKRILDIQENFQKLLAGLRGLNLTTEYSGLEWVAKEPMAVNDAAARVRLDELYAALDESDDIQNYFTSEA